MPIMAVPALPTLPEHPGHNHDQAPPGHGQVSRAMAGKAMTGPSRYGLQRRQAVLNRRIKATSLHHLMADLPPS